MIYKFGLGLGQRIGVGLKICKSLILGQILGLGLVISLILILSLIVGLVIGLYHFIGGIGTNDT